MNEKMAEVYLPNGLQSPATVVSRILKLMEVPQ